MLRCSILSTKRTRRETNSGSIVVNTIIPDTPIWNSVTATLGTINASWYPVLTLREGGSISLGPLTSHEFRWGTTEASVDVGGTPTGTQALSAGATSHSQGVAAGTWWCSVVASNAAGASDPSIPFEIIVP